MAYRALMASQSFVSACRGPVMIMPAPTEGVPEAMALRHSSSRPAAAS